MGEGGGNLVGLRVCNFVIFVNLFLRLGKEYQVRVLFCLNWL